MNLNEIAYIKALQRRKLSARENEAHAQNCCASAWQNGYAFAIQAVIDDIEHMLKHEQIKEQHNEIKAAES